MKKYISIILSVAAVLFAGCEEFQPVFTGKYDTPQTAKVYTDEDFGGAERFTPISELWDMYNAAKGPVTITGDVVIKGQVVSSDKSGNIYKSLYLQDETGGIELKMGKYSLYNEYKIGQWVYVVCTDLTVGAYYGMVQIGFKSFDPKYETAYLEHSFLIDQYVFKGEMAPEEDVFKPKVIAGQEIWDEKNLATIVTIEGLSYDNHIFMIGYINPNIVNEEDKKSGTNRFFLDEEDPDNWSVNSWAASEKKFAWYVNEGCFDAALMGDMSTPFATYKAQVIPTAYTISQRFVAPGLSGNKRYVVVRTSGYANFADTDIPQAVRDGSATMTATGILTLYISSEGPEIQITLLDLDGVKKADGSPWYDENGKVIE